MPVGLKVFNSLAKAAIGRKANVFLSRAVFGVGVLLSILLFSPAPAENQPDQGSTLDRLLSQGLDPRWSRKIPENFEAGSISVPLPREAAGPAGPRTFRLPGHNVTVFSNIRMHPSNTVHQSEMSLTTHPINPDVVLSGSNAADAGIDVLSQGWYYSTNAGATWTGSDTLPTHSNLNRFMSDPAVVIDRNGNLFFNTLYYGNGTGDVIVVRSTNNGVNWNQVTIPNSGIDEDKNHFAVDVNAGGPFEGNLYTAYTEFNASPGPIELSRSTNGGAAFSSPISISGSIGAEFAQGVNLAVGPDGEVFATWSGYDNFPTSTTRLGFNKSTTGGANWQTAISAGNVADIRGSLNKGGNSIRVNSFPSMAVDRSSEPRRGWIYIVYPAKNPSTPDIFMVRSTNGGVNWSAPVKVNQDNSGKDQWFSWASVDPASGDLYVVYYDSRNFPANDSAQVFISSSTDGGATFSDLLVSDHAFLPRSIPGLASGYSGDYIGIAALNGIVWPCWNDNRTNLHQGYTARVEYIPIGGPPKISVSPDTLDFGNVYVGYPETLSVSIRNLGSPDTLNVSSVQANHPIFSPNLTSFALGGGLIQTVKIACNPGASGPLTANLDIASNDTANPVVSVALLVNGVDPPVAHASPDSLVFTLNQGDSGTAALKIANSGLGNLNWSINLTTGPGLTDPLVSSGEQAVLFPQTFGASPAAPVFPGLVPSKEFGPSLKKLLGTKGDSGRPGHPVRVGSGGPDSFGYSWIDSDEPGGPVFNWIDISFTATATVGGLTDDNFAGPFPIGFSFNYYGTPYTQFYVGSNGFIGFGPPTDYGSNSNAPLPNTATPNNFLPFCWDDLDPQGGIVYYKTGGGRLVVQFKNYGEFGGAGRINAEVILRSDGSITYQYLNFLNGFDALSSSVGIENGDGSDGLGIVFNSDYLHNNLAVLFSANRWLSVSPESGALLPGDSVEVEVSAKTGLLALGTYNGEVRINTNDPGQPLLTVPVRLTVTTCASLRGDMDADGDLTSTDVILGLNCVFLGSGNCDLCFADLDCDGFLTSTDAVILLNMVFLGLPAGC